MFAKATFDTWALKYGTKRLNLRLFTITIGIATHVSHVHLCAYMHSTWGTMLSLRIYIDCACWHEALINMSRTLLCVEYVAKTQGHTVYIPNDAHGSMLGYGSSGLLQHKLRIMIHVYAYTHTHTKLLYLSCIPGMKTSNFTRGFKRTLTLVLSSMLPALSPCAGCENKKCRQSELSACY